MFSSLTDRAVSLEPFGLKREIPEFEGHKRADYIDRCDLTTLFYDAFESHDGKHIIIVAPKAIGFEKQLKAAKFLIEGKAVKARHRLLKLVHEIWIKRPKVSQANSIDVEVNGFNKRISIDLNRSSAFTNKRMISTLCKDTPISWILDWIEFHKVNQNIDAAVLFENSDTPDHAKNIYNSIKKTFPDLELTVIHAPFPYGPPHILDLGFLQTSLWQLLRWKFAQSVTGLLVCDIDEFVVCEDDISIFDKVQKSFLGYYQFDGEWIEAASTDNIQSLLALSDRRHSMFRHTARPPRKTHRKWVAIPSRIPKDIQFKIHGLRPEPKYAAWLHPFYTRFKGHLKSTKHYHFIAISNSWKSDRNDLDLVDTTVHQLCKPLDKAFKRVRQQRTNQLPYATEE